MLRLLLAVHAAQLVRRASIEPALDVAVGSAAEIAGELGARQVDAAAAAAGSGALRIGGQEVPLPGVAVEQGEAFAARDRRNTVDELVIHESVTKSVAATVTVLKRRKLGVHLIVGPDGTVTQHGDLLTKRMAHGSPHNRRSIGLEIVNPYYERYQTDDWPEIIDATWAHKKKYVLPTRAQMESVKQIIETLSSGLGIDKLRLPRNYIGLKKGKLAAGRVDGADKEKPGIYAHHYFGHADGSFAILYAFLRLEAGMSADAAYDSAVQRAAAARWRGYDVSDIEYEK